MRTNSTFDLRPSISVLGWERRHLYYRPHCTKFCSAVQCSGTLNSCRAAKTDKYFPRTTSKSVKWLRETPSPDELSTIAVFDAHCARAYLKEGEAAYLPYGMDIVVNLADKVIPKLKQRLDTEISGINVDATPFNHLLGQTTVGELIANLSHKTNPTKINTLATLSEAKTSRIAELKVVLSEADPKAKAQECKLSAGRIKDIATGVDAALRWVKDEAVTK